jgi:hypothetical protein
MPIQQDHEENQYTLAALSGSPDPLDCVIHAKSWMAALLIALNSGLEGSYSRRSQIEQYAARVAIALMPIFERMFLPDNVITLIRAGRRAFIQGPFARDQNPQHLAVLAECGLSQLLAHHSVRPIKDGNTFAAVTLQHLVGMCVLLDIDLDKAILAVAKELRQQPSGGTLPASEGVLPAS